MKLSEMLERLADNTKDYIARSLRPLEQRQDALEAAIKAIPKPEKGEKGEKGDPGVGKDGRDGIDGKNGESVKGDRGERGADADPEAVRALVKEEVSAAVAAIPVAKDGAPGASIIAGDGPPLSAGRAGDVYLDVKTGDVYRFA
jgi:hypothetical protein